MLKTLAIVVVALLAGVLIFAATRPDSFRVERKTSIQAPPEKIFPLLVDFHRWQAWSPWEKMDPAMQRTHSGAASGQGAVYAWQGNSKVGQGRMEITSATPPSALTLQLDFLSPFEAHNVAEFTLVRQGESTELSWTMHGPSPYVSKLMGLVFDMDTLIGRDFEAGLANLKALAEK